MGIEWHTSRFLIACSKTGTSFTRTLTLGHQHFHLSAAEVHALFAEFGGAPGGVDEALSASAPYADGIMRLLGAQDLVTVDASAYEGASVVYDMNAPLEQGGPAVRALRGGFDTVFDGGTLEHIFNFPTAVKNAMEMVKVGGHLLLQTPANNFFGHGFYQFSPELFYRILSPENGFVVERMIAFEVYPGSQWYEVSDPAVVKARVELVGPAQRVLLLIRARRTHEAAIFRAVPQQSDYASAWRAHQADNGRARERSSGAARNGIGFARRLTGYIGRHATTIMKRMGPGTSRFVEERDAVQANRRFALRAQPGVFRPVDK